MKLLKKNFLFALIFLFGTEFSVTEPRKLKLKLNRTRKEVAQVFKTDDQQGLAQEVKNINVQTPQDRQIAKIELQKEITKEKNEIRADLTEAQQSQSDYISYDQALEIITSNKELSYVKHSSWTKSAIIKPFTQTYRLFLRVWNPKEYTSLLEKERKALEHELNVQAYNNLMLLYVALDLELKKTDLNIEHMFKKDHFYNIATNAFEGGAILAQDIELSQELLTILNRLGQRMKDSLYFHYGGLIPSNYTYTNMDIDEDPTVLQSIYAMNHVIKQASELKRKDFGYNFTSIENLCEAMAQNNGKILHDNKKSYPQYLKDWISQPKNAAKAGLVIAAIGGLYLYGPAVPQWLKDYTNSSIGSMKDRLSRGYQATISSMKNLWNKVRGNQESELPDSKEARMDAQEQESETDDYFIQEGKSDADNEEFFREVKSQIIARDKARNEKQREDREQRQREKEAVYPLFEVQTAQEAHADQEAQIASDEQQAGQMLNDFDEEVHADQFRKDLQRRNWEADQAKAREAEELEKIRVAHEQANTEVLENTRVTREQLEKKIADLSTQTLTEMQLTIPQKEAQALFEILKKQNPEESSDALRTKALMIQTAVTTKELAPIAAKEMMATLQNIKTNDQISPINEAEIPLEQAEGILKGLKKVKEVRTSLSPEEMIERYNNNPELIEYGEKVRSKLEFADQEKDWHRDQKAQYAQYNDLMEASESIISTKNEIKGADQKIMQAEEEGDQKAKAMWENHKQYLEKRIKRRENQIERLSSPTTYNEIMDENQEPEGKASPEGQSMVQPETPKVNTEFENIGGISANPTSGLKEIPSEYLTTIVGTGIKQYDIPFDADTAPNEVLQIANAQINLLDNELKDKFVITFDEDYENRHNKEYWIKMKQIAEQKLAAKQGFVNSTKKIPSEYLATIIRPTERSVQGDVNNDPNSLLKIANAQINLLDNEFNNQKSFRRPRSDDYVNKKNMTYWSREKRRAEEELKKRAQ